MKEKIEVYLDFIYIVRCIVNLEKVDGPGQFFTILISLRWRLLYTDKGFFSKIRSKIFDIPLKK